MDRRSFLKTTAATAAVVSVPAILLSKQTAEAAIIHKWPVANSDKWLKAVVDYIKRRVNSCRLQPALLDTANRLGEEVNAGLELWKRMTAIQDYEVSSSFYTQYDIGSRVCIRAKLISQEGGHAWFGFSQELLPMLKWKDYASLLNEPTVFHGQSWENVEKPYWYQTRTANAWLSEENAYPYAWNDLHPSMKFWGPVEVKQGRVKNNKFTRFCCFTQVVKTKDSLLKRT